MPWIYFCMELLCLSREYKRNHSKIPTETPTTSLEYFNIKLQILLTDIGGEWYLRNMRNKKPTSNNPSLTKREQ